MFDSNEEEAARWYEAITKRTRESDHAYLRELLHSTLSCLRKSVPVKTSAEIAAALPPSVRGLWFGGWSPSDIVETCSTTAQFISCVKPLLAEHHAEAVIEEDVLAVTQTFFAQWPQAKQRAQEYLPNELMDSNWTNQRGSSIA